MKVIVCNVGSSSLKFQLLDMDHERCLARGHIERVGTDGALATYWVRNSRLATVAVEAPSQDAAVRLALAFLTDRRYQLVALEEIDGVGFKCVQAGERNGSVRLDREVLDAMRRYSALAPAHNPPYIRAIEQFRALLPETPLVGVFEPGFHVDHPRWAQVYGTPWDWIEAYGVRRYGYHGASHRFLAGEAVRLLGLDPEQHRIISCHLGGSSSLCAVRNGRSIDTSMGFTPQSGLIQGTRIGDLDPFVLPYIMREKGITLEQALAECGRQAGLAGLSGTSGDMRDILEAIRGGSDRARLARDKFIYDVKRYVGQYLVLLEGLDAIVFAGGIGEKDAELRAAVLRSLAFLGVRCDPEANVRHEQRITTTDSTAAAMVLETNEEIVVARETVRVISQASKRNPAGG